MEDARTDGILAEYDRNYGLYTEFTSITQTLLWQLLKDRGIRVHTIPCRTKERESLAGKLRRSDREYSSLQDITDLAGVRIITYFSDEVDQIAEIVETEFDIDEANSVDKRKLLDPDRFGYLSRHYVCGLSKDRLNLTEYKRFSDCKVEIQIRSILQHAWAEIEHDLGYKSKEAVPRDIRRSFARLAGLLEIADTQFDEIRDALARYAQDVPSKIAESPASVLVDKVSLQSFVASDDLSHACDSVIARALGTTIRYGVEYAADHLLLALSYHGITTIDQLSTLLQDSWDQVREFAVAWITQHKSSTFAGVSLFYACFYKVARTGSEEAVLRYMESFGDLASSRKVEHAKAAVAIYSRM